MPNYSSIELSVLTEIWPWPTTHRKLSHKVVPVISEKHSQKPQAAITHRNPRPPSLTETNSSDFDPSSLKSSHINQFVAGALERALEENGIKIETRGMSFDVISESVEN